MAERAFITVSGVSVEARTDMTVAAAILNAGVDVFEAPPLCAMGVCMQCAVSINGERGERACQRLCEEGMRVERL